MCSSTGNNVANRYSSIAASENITAEKTILTLNGKALMSLESEIGFSFLKSILFVSF
ncbi:MAG: hypothetical protein QXF23_03745 [Candidatus Bathyarchaeia archaeon]